MARYLLRKQEVSVLRQTVEESLRSSVARQMEQGTRMIRRSILLGGLLSRTIGSCRRVLREKMMLDSLGQ